MIRALLGFALFLLAMHIAYMFTYPLVKNRMLEAKLVDLASNRAGKTNAALRDDVLTYAFENKIDLTPEDVVVTERNGRFTIAAYYTTEVTYWAYTRRYAFYPASQESARLTWKGKKPLAQRHGS